MLEGEATVHFGPSIVVGGEDTSTPEVMVERLFNKVK